MMNTVIIITKDYSLLDKGIDGDNIIVSFVVENMEAIQKLKLDTLHHAVLFKNKNVYFSLHFKLDDKNNSSFIQYMQKQTYLFMQYFFHPKYYCVGDRPAVSIEGYSGAAPEVREITLSLNRQAVEQGFAGIHPIYFTDKDFIQKEELNMICYENADLNNFSAAYYELLSRQYYVSKYIGVAAIDYTGFTRALSATEAKLYGDEPGLFGHLLQFRQLKNTVVQLQEDISLAHEDLANQKAYLKIFKDQDESVKINQFYHNEYEVLPLWYKQFGHLIKAVMGKRTWRSLINNNVKKYIN